MAYFYIIISFFFLGGFFYKFIFLRDNGNHIPLGENLVSPASGKVISIQVVDDKSSIKIKKGFMGGIETAIEAEGPYYLINIFMSPFDVHINKMPMDGKIISIERKAGKFLPVTNVKNALQNEKQEFLIESKIGRIKVIQIAGILARRNRSYVRVGDSLKKGQKLGIILLGSQVALLFPKKHYQLKVKLGQHVSSGETIICDLYPLCH